MGLVHLYMPLYASCTVYLAAAVKKQEVTMLNSALLQVILFIWVLLYVTRAF